MDDFNEKDSAQKEKPSMLKNILWFIVAGIAAFIVLHFSNRDTKTEQKQAKQTEQKQEEKVKPRPIWEYYDGVDKMDNKKIKAARTISTNTINFGLGFEYTDFTLTVRNLNAGQGNEITMRSNNEYPFLLSYNYSEKCRVKFDDEQPSNYSYNAGKATASTIFFNKPNQFISKLKKAEKLMIGCTFYGRGEEIIEFNVKGLVWD